MLYQAGADAVVVVHLLFIGFVVGGVFLAWRWPRIIWVHIPAVVYGALVEFAGFTCPLTSLENDLRRHAGKAGYHGGFIDHYLVRVIYPPGLTRTMEIGLGLLVLLTAAIGYRGFARRHLPGAIRPKRSGRALLGLSADTDCHGRGSDGFLRQSCRCGPAVGGMDGLTADRCRVHGGTRRVGTVDNRGISHISGVLGEPVFMITKENGRYNDFFFRDHELDRSELGGIGPSRRKRHGFRHRLSS